jgi:dipeptide/tripeptide permease
LSPIPGAILADQYFGRYRVIKYSSGLYVLGLALLFITSLPISRDHDLGLPGLLGAFVLIGLGTGGIKSTLPALIADQFPKHRPLPVTVDEALRGKCVSKESVFVDREMSAAR